MQIQQIALITCESLGNYTANADSEDERLYQFLKGKGLPVSWQVWDDASIDWSQFDALIIKSPWDYFDKIDAFYTWLDKVEAAGCKVLNPVKTVRWNADKIYFKDLEQNGVTIVPTVWLEQGNTFNAESTFAELGSEKIIVKPRVSGGAKNTFALTREEAAEKTEEINQLLQQEPFLAQPFIEEIKTAGEWSFIFFNGNYSHTVLKTYEGKTINRVLYATDFDKADTDTLENLQHLLQPFAPVIECVHVADDLSHSDNRKLEDLRSQLQQSATTNLTYTLLEGDDVADALQKFVSEQAIDLIAVTTRSRTLLGSLLNPSLTKRLVLESQVPLLIFHASDEV